MKFSSKVIGKKSKCQFKMNIYLLKYIVAKQNLPFMHMIPKFHKPTLDFRYIAAGTKCSTKPLAKILTGVFKLIDRTLKYSDNFQFKFKDTSGLRILDSEK